MVFEERRFVRLGFEVKKLLIWEYCCGKLLCLSTSWVKLEASVAPQDTDILPPYLKQETSYPSYAARPHRKSQSNTSPRCGFRHCLTVLGFCRCFSNPRRGIVPVLRDDCPVREHICLA
jgi:hypothetical protein